MTGTSLQRPRLSLSIGVAGKRDLEGRSDGVEQRLAEILGDIVTEIDSIRTAESSDYLALRFDLDSRPRLTLVSGLADGADQVAVRAFQGQEASHPGVQFTLGAILPCSPADFVANSPVSDVATFERQLQAAAFTLELDGEMPVTAGAADPDAAKRARAYSFRAQSAFLLRHSDLLIAVDSPAAASTIGGTQDTLRAARERGLPVILLQMDGSIRILRSPRDFDRLPPAADDLRQELRALVRSLVGAAQPRDPRYVSDLLGEFFGDQVPPDGRANRLWQRFEAMFRAPAAPTPTATPGPQQGIHRLRASALARHYAGMYRGAILIGYTLAVAAVALAVCALVTLLSHPDSHFPEASWFFLLFLAGLKLFVLIKILRLIERGNHRRLAYRAADFRYLSERLRAMVYLPLVGSFRPPPQLSRPYSTRVESQSVIDRLFDAIVRDADPHGLMPTDGGTTFRPDPRAAMEMATCNWLDEQIAYHKRNCETLTSMSHSIESAGRAMNKAVILIVAIDLAIVLLSYFLPEQLAKAAHGPVAILLLSFAAVLPAAVANLNGIRFQTECTRMADRSAQMAGELEQLRLYLETLGGSVCLLDVLHAMEDIARLTLDEVAEWSGIFGKELVDP